MVSKTVEASFPSNIERIVASALLQLSACPSRGRIDSSSGTKSFESSEFSNSKSGGSSLISEASVDAESSRSQQLTPVAYVSGLHDLKLKVVRKKRSKSICISSNSKKLKPNKPELTPAPASSESVSEITTETSSCFSSSSSAQSYSNATNVADKLWKPVMPGHISCRAAAILRVLSKGTASEVRIRQLLGDSPSTSKALRMLLKLQEVKRFGAGGRGDPYIYMIA
ncbi:hypothetical protein ACS0TY_031722 [Phlomoides rotata]